MTYDEHRSARMCMGHSKPKAPSGPEPKVIEISMDDFRALWGRIQAQRMEPVDWEMLNLFMGSYFGLLEVLRNNEISAARLRKILFVGR